MGYYDQMKQKLEHIYTALIDEESRDWFDAKIEYMITREPDNFLNSLFALSRKYKKNWRHIGMERFVKGKEYQGIVVYGCGHDGKATKEILDLCGYPITCWCDSSKQIVGSEVKGLKVISTEELVENYRECLVIVASTKYKSEIKERLRAFGFPLERVAAFSDNAYDWAITGIQYFDMFSPSKKEVFIDGGSYNGDTVFDFIKWNRENEYKVYSLEPMQGMYEYILKRLEKYNISNVRALNCAAWDKKEELFFRDMVDGSRVVRGGNREGVKVDGETIDDIVGMDEVTFIKLDVEGAELEALKGASRTIQKYRPKIAVCIYHMPTDILDIGNYLLELNSDYKFAIRHYTLTIYETVLYAIP